MYVIIGTEETNVEVNDGDTGYNPDVLDDLCRRAITTTVDLYRELSKLEDEVTAPAGSKPGR